MKSSTASPSLRNSGLLQTWKGNFASRATGLGDFRGTSYRNGGFSDDDDLSGHVPTNKLRDLQDILEICGSVFAGRRSHSDENYVGGPDRFGQLGRKR